MDFDKVVRARASVKKYSSKKPPIEKITEIIECANMAFTHGNLHILKYIIVENTDTIAQISRSCQQEFIKEVPYVVVICSDPKLAKNMYDIRADKYIKHHAGAAAENFLLKVCDLGLAASWIGAFSESSLRNALNIPDNIDIEILITVGYELNKSKTKQSIRQSLNKRVFFEQWENRFYKPFAKVRRDDI